LDENAKARRPRRVMTDSGATLKISSGIDGASKPGRLIGRGGERPRSGLSYIERSWTADERTAPKIKSQSAVRVSRNADPNAPPDFAGFVIPASEPQRAFSAQIEPIQPMINPQRRGDPSWPSRQVAEPLDLTISLHNRDAVARLKRPDEDPSPDPGYLA